MEKNVKANAIENELGVDVAKETRRLHEEGSFKRTLEIAQERRTQQTSPKKESIKRYANRSANGYVLSGKLKTREKNQDMRHKNTQHRRKK